MADVFRRPEYAQEIARDLLHPGPLQVGLQSGVFLAGDRRLGKTTFLRQDLIPALEAQGALTIYVDLWADRLRAPSTLVTEVVRKKIRELEKPNSTVLNHLRRINGLDIGLAGFKFGLKLDTPYTHGGPTLADVFAELVQLVRTDVVLIIDEVQHAVGTEDGMNLLHALKAARDRINTDSRLKGKFIFLGTGSHKSLVADMATRRSHPFAGATAVSFRVLGRDFVDWRLHSIRAQEPQAILPSSEVAAAGFGAMNNRPEELIKALLELQRQYSPEVEASADSLFFSICQTLASAAADVEIAVVGSMGLLASAIFSWIANGNASGLFGSEALEKYSVETGVPVDVPQVQNTVDRLIAANLIIRTGHGIYDVTDPFVRDAWVAAEQHCRLLAGVHSG